MTDPVGDDYDGYGRLERLRTRDILQRPLHQRSSATSAPGWERTRSARCDAAAPLLGVSWHLSLSRVP